MILKEVILAHVFGVLWSEKISRKEGERRGKTVSARSRRRIYALQ